MPKPKAIRAVTLITAALAVLALAIAGPAVAHGGSGDHGGFDDSEPAGTIASFDPDSGMLVIDLAEGGSISGLVTSRTWIESDDDSCDARRRAFHGWCRKQLHGSGKHHGWRHGQHGDVEDLVPGAIVEDALLVLKDGRAFFWKIELAD